MIKHVNSVEVVSTFYNTGERPVRVLCSDKSIYICKYKYKPTSVYKLVCEVIGSLMAQEWDIPIGIIETKILELFSDDWINSTWELFVEYYNETIKE